jgi:amidase
MASEDLIREYASRDAMGVAELVRSGEASPAEIVDAALTLIDRIDPKLNAIVIRTDDLARQMAAGELPDGPFRGVPYIMKDLGSLWQGVPTTNASRYMKDYVAPIDLELMRRVKQAGFVLVGKGNAPENGWAISTEPKLYGKTHNPWREDVTPGGSSGGSAAAVAARMVPIAEASDGAGSIRVPASCCGVVGLKPSRGRNTLAPAYVDFWHGCAYFLCVSRSVRDTAAYMDAVSGSAIGDPYPLPMPEEGFLPNVGAAPGRLRIGMAVSTPDGFPIDPEVVRAVRDTASLLESLGHTVEEHDLGGVDIPQTWQAYTRQIAVSTAAAWDAVAAMLGRRPAEDELEPLTWAIDRRGREITATQYALDIEAIRAAGRAIATDLAPYDVWLSPTLTRPPRGFGYWDMSMTDLDAYNARWTDAVFMFPFNISGQPAMSLPMHWTPDGLPVGVQLVGRHGDEATLLRVAAQLEEAKPWRDRKPPVSG